MAYAVVKTDVDDNTSEVFTGFRTKKAAAEFAEDLNQEIITKKQALKYNVTWGPARTVPAKVTPIKEGSAA